MYQEIGVTRANEQGNAQFYSPISTLRTIYQRGQDTDEFFSHSTALTQRKKTSRSKKSYGQPSAGMLGLLFSVLVLQGLELAFTKD